MKKKIALLLTIIMFSLCITPSFSLAAQDKGLEKAIRTAKEKFSIPAELTEFDYYTSYESDKEVWQLTWRSKEYSNGNMNISIDNKGNILSYSFYKPHSYEEKSLPKFSKQESKTKAEDFINKLYPELVKQLKYIDNSRNSLMEPAYYFNYVRSVNGIPFNNNTVFIEVNKKTGEVQSFYINWTEDIIFPDAAKAISLEDAQKAYKEKLGLRLAYQYTYEDEQINTFLVYNPRYSHVFQIDALTGEKINLTPLYYGEGGAGAKDEASRNYAATGELDLTPEERKAIEESSSLMNQSKAEKIARDFKPLGLTSELNLAHASLSRDWPMKQDFSWHLYFSKDAKSNMDDYQYANISIDAKTGEIKNFYFSTPNNANKKPIVDKSKAEANVNKFLKQLQPIKMEQVELDNSYHDEIIIYNNNEQPSRYNFRYLRKVNGVIFPSNHIQVTYDAVLDKVISFSMNWYDIEFAPIDKVIGLDKIYNIMFKEVGLELQYKLQYNLESSKIMPPQHRNQKGEVKLVYAPVENKPLLFDANTGVLLNYDGKPYKEYKPVQYTDIEGHFAEKQISVLAESSIAFPQSEFKPDQNILQKDFFLLLSKTIGYYGRAESSDDNKEIDELYRFLIREGILKQEEKAPDSNITREESIKFIIRALKYDKVADIKDIFNSSFKDNNQISPNLTGYIAIAKGLNIISGNNGYFYPKNKLTRAESAIIIYNYLKK